MGFQLYFSIPAFSVVVLGIYLFSSISFNFLVYTSENEYEVDFTDKKSLIWHQEGLEYGDWYSGDNGDGTITHSTTIQASHNLQVSIFGDPMNAGSA